MDLRGQRIAPGEKQRTQQQDNGQQGKDQAQDGQEAVEMIKYAHGQGYADTNFIIPEVVERVVWEVVPTLAETMIKEEIRRLTSD